MKSDTTLILLVCLTNPVFIRFASEADVATRDESQVSLEEQQEVRRRSVLDATLYELMFYGPGTVSLLNIETDRQKVRLQRLEKSKSYVLANVHGSALGRLIHAPFHAGLGRGTHLSQNNLSPVNEGFSMELMRISF